MIKGHASRYREVDILTMSPGRRLIALYTKLITVLKLGLIESRGGNIEARTTKLARAHEILEELLYTLDHERGGAIALNLAQLYEHFMTEVLYCSRHHDEARLQATISCLSELLDAWVQATEETEGAMASVAAAR